LFNGPHAASGYWEGLSPTAQEWVRGSPVDYKTDTESTKPVTWVKHFAGKVASFFGFGHYAAAFDAYTKAGIDVQSGATVIARMNSYSRNSAGADFNKTNQVAIVANASALDPAASASVTAINAIAESLYTGATPQQVVGSEVDVSVRNPAGWFSDTGKAYGVGYSAVLQDSSTEDGTVAFTASTSHPIKTWWHGGVFEGMSKTGVTIAREGAKVPETGVWVSAAGTFGIYVGAKNKHQLNPGAIANYTYRPAVGIALGQEGETSAASHKLRFINTTAGSLERVCDLIKGAPGNLEFHFDGTKRCEIQTSGGYAINDQQIIGARQTGWGANSGATSKAAFNTATATTQDVAQRLAALIQDLKNHGLIE
jgi:hypothetical protein